MIDPISYVHPDLRPLFERVRAMLGNAEITKEALGPLRARAIEFSVPSLPEPAWTERTVPGPAGAPDVRVCVVDGGTSECEPRPAILYIHGGGFIMGNAVSSIRNVQELAITLNCVIVTVDYRLAPETPFPGSLEDNYAALKWLYLTAAELGVDPMRIAVVGESAGGGHAAMLAIAARDRGEIPLAYQALIYPMLDDRTGSTRKAPPHTGMIIWNEQMNRFGWSSLLGMPAGSASVPYGAVPARVEDLRDLPPTFIGVGSIDLFVSEDIEYARRLIEAGVSVEVNVVPGAFHGFDAVGDTTLARQFKAALVAALSKALRGRAPGLGGSVNEVPR